ncbi:zinc-dependent alcohol dehydrogenase [Nocardia alni]|uniref:zinc-dependent alcohol dehydrogenase n=1 Tax=Nocardia alni TaxID=2815723 RepID=UPI001C219724|nr:alcohol dehydrogenase catalytic domain-containing protein [Nocardia alni]
MPEETVPETMRQVLVRSLEDVTLDIVPVPEPGAGEVLLRTVVAGICGSDMHAAQGSHPFIDLPYRPGHEVVARVEAVGPGVTDLPIGQRVVIEPNLTCGRCAQCRAGRYNICRELRVFGCQTPGGMADRFVIAADRLHPLPDEVSDAAAALVEPLATPVHAVRKAGPLTGRTVAVLGAGPIGLLVLVAARRAGASRIVITDLLATKRERALRMGADAALPADDPDLVAAAHAALDGPADVVFDCVTRERSLAQAIDLVTKGGQIVVVGVGASGGTSVRMDLVQDREIRIEGALMYVGEDFRAALELIRSGAVDVADMVTATFPLDQADRAFAACGDPEQVKVLITVP